VKGIGTDSLVEEIRQRIADTVGPQRFKLWFQDAKLKLHDDLLQVGVPNLFFQEWLQAKFTDVLSQAAAQVVGQDVHVRFHVDGELFRQMRSRQDDSSTSKSVIDNVLPEKVSRPATERRLRHLSLENFVVGPCNRLAHAAARQVAEDPGGSFNPLFIHGSVGLGKTHLLCGIQSAIRATDSGLKVRYLSAEEFTNEYVQCMRNGGIESFRRRFRKLDVLMIDDIQFFANKTGTQEEFLHTFNALESENRQVVVASDSHPKVMSRLNEGLINRFMAGMVCRMEAPATETRVAILKAKAVRFKKPFPRNVLTYIAQSLRGSVRELEGALNCLAAYSSLVKHPIDLAMAREALGEMIAQTIRVIQLKDIERVICALFGLEHRDLCSRKRVRSISYPRMMAMYLARKHTQACYAAIGKFFGNKNHSTVMNAERTVARWLKEKQQFRIAQNDFDVTRVLATLEKELNV